MKLSSVSPLRLVGFLLTTSIVLIAAVKWWESRQPLTMVSTTVGEGGAFDAKPDIPGVERALVVNLDGVLKQHRKAQQYGAEWNEINYYRLYYDPETKVLTYTLNETHNHGEKPKVIKIYQNVTPEEIHLVAMKKGRASMFDAFRTKAKNR